MVLIMGIAVRASSVKTPQPTPTSLSSLPSATASPRQRISALRQICLIRDHHQGVISQNFDRHEAERRLQQDGEDCRDNDGEPLRNRSNDQSQFLEVAHILPHSLTSAASDNTELVGRLLLIIATLLTHCSERVEEKRSSNSER